MRAPPPTLAPAAPRAAATNRIWQFFGAATPAASDTGSFISTNASGTFIQVWINATTAGGGTCTPPMRVQGAGGLATPRLCVGVAGGMWPQLRDVAVVTPTLSLNLYDQRDPQGVTGTLAVTDDDACAPVYLYSASPFGGTSSMQVYAFRSPSAARPPVDSWAALPPKCPAAAV